MKVPEVRRLLLQGFNYALFMAVVWYFSLYPAHRRLADDEAVITLAFGHTSQRVEECRTLSQEQLNELAPNMRTAVDCPRERSPVRLELTLDDEVATRMDLVAPGLYKDQGVDVYRDITAAVGEHRLSVWLNDDVNVDGPTYRFERAIELQPAQRLVVTFDATRGGFYLK